MEAGENAPSYVEYKNPLIESAFTHIDKTIDKICAISQVPRELFGSEKGGVEKVEALNIRLLPFIKKLNRAKRAYREGLTKILKIMFKAEGQELDTGGLEIDFDAGLPIDRLVEARSYETAINAGIISKKRAISKFNKIEGDELDDEIEAIKEQEKITPIALT